MATYADIKGLPLILGGEIRAVSKLASRRESVVILVRGPAGSGKTLLATHLAAHEALVRGGDIVYCCIELLPSELDAQISGLTFGPEHRPLRVSNLPTGDPPPTELAPRIFASIIDVPETSEPDFGAELHRVMSGAREAQLDPRIIVIDSLAEGYRLGASVPRHLADALAKFAAEEGILLVLLEEVIDQRDSTWTFVADVVLELAHHGATGTSAAEERAITVRKNRFGPAHVGPHAFAIHQDRGVEIYPRLSAYLSTTAHKYFPQDDHRKPSLKWRFTKQAGIDILSGAEVVLVTGEDATLVSMALARLIQGVPSLRLDMTNVEPAEERILHLNNPFLGPERMISEACSKLEELSGAVSALVIGDLEAINYNIDPDGLRRALPVLIMIAQSAGLAIALCETASQREPLSRHLADTIVHVNRNLPTGIEVKLRSRFHNIANRDFELPH